MDKTEVNMNVLNKVIAFKMLEIAHENGLIDDKKYIGKVFVAKIYLKIDNN